MWDTDADILGQDTSADREVKMNNFLAYVEENVTVLAKEEQALIASSRKDEANLVKIKSNVYGIAKSMFEVVQKMTPEENRRRDLLKRLEHLKATWEEAYEKVKSHNDVEKMVVEEVKLETLNRILDTIRKTETEEAGC